MVLELCAGRGGKTLQLAAQVGPSGRILSADLDPKPLQRLRELEGEGVVGRVAEEHYGFGLAPDPEPLLVSAREVARRLREAQVDLALLVPA